MKLPDEITELLDAHFEHSKRRAELNHKLSIAKGIRDSVKSREWLRYRQSHTLVETDHLVATNEGVRKAEEDVEKLELEYELENAALQNTYRRLLAFNAFALSMQGKQEAF